MNKSLLLASLLILSLWGCNKSIQVNEYDIIPQPKQINYTESYLSINTGIHIQSNSPEGILLQDFFKEALAKRNAKHSLYSRSEGSTPVLLTYENNMPSEHYKLIVDTEKIRIEASSNAGWLYGLQSLLQMFPYHDSFTGLKIKCCEITDEPRFLYRGMHFDVSRHFFTIDELKDFADKMLNYKLNKLHLHLTDDQGWRLEIEKYPLLTEKGAWRTPDKNDSLCMQRAIEDATYIIPEDRYDVKDGQKMYGGYYTKDEMREFIHYCNQRNIEIIPEIDIPGHFKAAIDNYSYLSCTDEAGWGDHFSYPACLGKPSTYTFIEDVLTEVAELFPSQYIHIGGDEVNKDEWKKCLKCQTSIRKNKLKDEHELQSYFNLRIEQFLSNKGKKLMGWDEIVEGGISSSSTVMWWRNWAPHTIRDAAKNGNNVIVTPDFEYYLDFPYSATPTRKVYDFEPVPDDFTNEMEQYIIGVQANIWTERIPNTNRLYYQVLPRMLALAETAWSPRSKNDYADFKRRLEMHSDKFLKDKVFYHLPTLSGFEEKTIFTKTAVFNLNNPPSDIKIYYTLDGSAPTPEANLFTQAIEISQSCKVRFRAYKGHVFSEIYESIYELQEYSKPVSKDVKAGLKRQLYKGRFNKTEAVNTKGIANAEIIVANFGIEDLKGQDNYALVFTGYYKAPKDGIYRFFTVSDDGDQLFIDDQLVVDNDGSHGPRERTGAIALSAGLHPLRLIYRQIGGGAHQKVFVQMPDEDKRELIDTELFY